MEYYIDEKLINLRVETSELANKCNEKLLERVLL